MEKFGLFKFTVFFDDKWEGWSFKIYDHSEKEVMESKEIYSHEGIARYAVIGQIALLEIKLALTPSSAHS